LSRHHNFPLFFSLRECLSSFESLELSDPAEVVD
jgi:hypothetical protein